MKKILNIQSSPRGKASVTIQLADAIIGKLTAAYPGSTIETIDLARQTYPHLEEVHIASFFTPASQHTVSNKLAIRHSDETIRAVMDADILVIGAPMYNFSIPSQLKTWIDHVVRRGATFAYSEKGPEGLVKGKKVYIAIASGGIYSEGPMKNLDFTEPYLRGVLGFIGLTDITVFRAEGLSIPGVQEAALEKAMESIRIDRA
jgi:FMN-dependent NADH-azoreductase